MRVPDECIGEWTGIVYDDWRKALYSCTFILGTTDGTIRYDQKRGTATGKHIILSETPLVLDEDYTGPEGGKLRWKLTLKLTASGQLECIWTMPGRRCTATLDRAQSQSDPIRADIPSAIAAIPA
jgi:hypothetical protein